MPEFKKLQGILGYHFNNLGLLKRALTHRSCAKTHNERLEFLGDSLLGFLIARRIYQLYPDLDEGDLTRMRSALVNKEALAETARNLRIGDYLYLGRGEENSGGRNRDSVLADAVEAIIGAVYLDTGIDAARGAVNNWFKELLAAASDAQPVKDAKTALQEWLQQRSKPVPQYELVNTGGEAHSRLFTVSCKIDQVNKTISATASSRRKAEQLVAEQLLSELEQEL